MPQIKWQKPLWQTVHLLTKTSQPSLASLPSCDCGGDCRHGLLSAGGTSHFYICHLALSLANKVTKGEPQDSYKIKQMEV